MEVLSVRRLHKTLFRTRPISAAAISHDLPLRQVLDIRKNEFKALPDPLEYYTDLRKLNVSHNHLVNLGGVLRNCELLEEIWAQERAVCIVLYVLILRWGG